MADKQVFSNAVIDKLKSIFKLQINPSAKEVKDRVVFTRPDVNASDKGQDKYFKKNNPPIKWDEETQELYNWWWSTTHTNVDDYKNRSLLYEDMDVLFLNAQRVIKASKIICGEVIQADSNNEPIFIDAKRPVKKFIQEFFDKININYYLRQTVKDFVKYGNAFWILEFDQTGVSKILPVSPYDVVDRIEFTPYEVRKMLDTNDKFLTQYRQLDRMDQYIDDIVNKDSSASYFDSYLIGFQVDDKIIPPWKLLHFRNLTNDSPFKPFGVPVFIHAMSAYRQYDAAMSLQITARGMKFPKNHWKLTIPNTVSPSDVFEYVSEFMAEYQNSGFTNSKKDLAGIGDNVVSVEGLIDYSQIVPEIELGKMEDVEMLLSDLSEACIVPRNLIDPNDSSYGDSGVSLAEKFKPFARFVYEVQNYILEQITQLVKIHMITSGSQFATEDVQFILSMPYPESQTNADIINSQSSLLGLANDVITALSDKLMGGETLPPEIIRQVYTKFLPYDDEIIDRWISDTIKAKEELDVEQEQQTEDDFGFASEGFDTEEDEQEAEQLGGEVDDALSSADDVLDSLEDTNIDEVVENIKRKARRKWRLLEKKMGHDGKSKLQEQVENQIFESTFSTIRERSIAGRHLYSSKLANQDFDVLKLRQYDITRVKLLQEAEEEASLDRQELNYVYVPFEEPKPKELKKKKKRKTKDGK
jgi:hypothetical protein